MSLDLTINMAPNRDVITPLDIGEITYSDPEILTTNIITEILVLDAPVPFQRFAATAPFNSVSQSSTYPDLLQALQTGQTGPTSNLISSGIGFMGGDFMVNVGTSPQLNLSDNWQALVNARIALRETASQVGSWKTDGKIIISTWATPNSQAFGPQLDLFSRYNKWFASASWLTASGSPTESYLWPVLFIYVDRVQKKLFNVAGTITALNETSEDNGGVTKGTIRITSVVVSAPIQSSTIYTINWSVDDESDYEEFVIKLGHLFMQTVAVVPGQLAYTATRVYTGMTTESIVLIARILKETITMEVLGRKSGQTVQTAQYEVIRILQ
jgi:hypothetical protein